MTDTTTAHDLILRELTAPKQRGVHYSPDSAAAVLAEHRDQVLTCPPALLPDAPLTPATTQENPMATPEPIVQPTRYTVNCMPEQASPDAHVFAIVVEYRGEGRWAATRHHRSLGADGAWSYGPAWPADDPGSREPATDAEYAEYYAARDAWLATHRFDLDTALELAKTAAPLVKVNGLTVEAALARIAALNAAPSA